MCRMLLAGMAAAVVLAWLPSLGRAQQPRVSSRVVPRTLRLELTLADDAKVRVGFPLPRFDTRGLPIKYRPEELKKYKGDDPAEMKLPGYKADFANLKKGDTVQVALSVLKPDRKDKEKFVWAPGETVSGTVVEAKQPKIVLDVAYAKVEVSIPGVAPGALDSGIKPGTKVPVDPAKARAAVILIVKEAEPAK